MIYPKLRPIEAFPIAVEDRRMVYIRDPLSYAKDALILPYPTFFIASLFDGRRSLLDIQEAFARQFGQILLTEDIHEIARRLDEHYYLESERFTARREEFIEAFRRSPLREMAHADTCYSSQPQEFTAQMGSVFSPPAGPGLPDPGTPADKPLRGLIAPHIDLRVGGPCYAWAYKELAERSDADVFIVLGTSHYGTGRNLFAATTKDYDTPLGPVKTDGEFLAALARRYGGDLFADEVLHRSEHSVEFQALFLRYALGERREFTVVPVLVSSFHEMVAGRTPPAGDPRVADFLHALEKTIAASDKRVCLVAGVDFAHVGHKFGDDGPLTDEVLDWVAREDRRLIEALENVDHEAFFAEIAKDGDRRRICGFSAMYTLLHLVGAREGRLLKYDRSRETPTQSSVSFASLAFY